jgi:agmatine/peptidylarginine deiminase
LNREIRFRAEWETQSAVLLTWPHAGSDWAETLDSISRTYLDMVRTLSRDQQVIVVAHDENLERHLSTLLPGRNVTLALAPTNDTWIRDYGPLSLESNGAIAHINFRFDAWGGKYEARLDNAVSKRLDEQGLFGCGMRHDPLVLEGGAVETDGRGTLLATRGSVICERRNPGLGQRQIEQRVGELLGIGHFLWIDCDGLHGDDTDGHIDTIVRFADEQTLLYATCSQEHPDHAVLAHLEQQVLALRQRNGRPYRAIALPCPGIHRDANGRMLPASYANFLIANTQVLLPVYAQDNDAKAIDIMRHAFPGREIVPVDSRALIAQNGSIHCATMQTACPLASSGRNQSR